MTSGLPLGKLPPDLLARLLGGVPRTDPRVIVPASLGVDAAAIDLGDRVLLAAADPITFIAERAGWYAVTVNANDIAVMGGEPRWFLATVLLPDGIAEAAVAAIFADVTRACAEIGATLVGGHTEVTYGIDRPIIAGTMLGEAPPGGVVTSGGARAGDLLIMTGSAGIEGTAALADVAANTLRARGVSQQTLDRAARYLDDPGISVVHAARALRADATPHAMHDATEGGVATALRELAEASNVGLQIEDWELSIPVRDETHEICRALDLNPLGLLGSGSLIAAVSRDDEDRVLRALRQARVQANVIGSVVPAEFGLFTTLGPDRRPLTTFPRDELARWLAEQP